MLTWEKSNGFVHKVSKQNHLMNILNFNFLWLFAFNILILSISGHQHCYSILSILILINACHYCNKIACNQYLLKISHGSFHTYAPLVIIQWWWSTSLFTLHLKSVITHHQELFFNPRTSVFFCPLQLDFLEMLWLFYIFVYSKFHHHQLHISMPSNWGQFHRCAPSSGINLSLYLQRVRGCSLQLPHGCKKSLSPSSS